MSASEKCGNHQRYFRFRQEVARLGPCQRLRPARLLMKVQEISNRCLIAYGTWTVGPENDLGPVLVEQGFQLFPCSHSFDRSQRRTVGVNGVT
jgi:hypothetical protein